MSSRNAVMEYLGSDQARLTANNQYEIIAWFNPSGASLNALVIADDGNLYVAQALQDATQWSTVHI